MASHSPTMPTPLAILTQTNHTPPPQAALPEVSESLRCSGSVVSFGAPSNRGSEQREGDRELGLLLYRLRDMVCGEGERKAFEQLKRGLAEDIERLNQAFLCQEEITALRAYEGPLNELREMEQELLPFAYVERPQARISVLEIALTVEPRCAEVLKEIQRLQEACKQLLSSDSLKQLCHFCLHLINCINGHTGTQAKAPSDTNHPFGPSRALPPSSIPRPPFTAKSKLPPPPPKVRPPNHSARKSPPTPREELPTRIPGPSATTKAKNGGGAASTAINGGREVHGGIRGFHLGDLKKLADYKDKRGSTKVTLLHAVVCALTEVAYQREGGKGIDTKWQQQQQHNVDQADVYSDMDASPSSSRFGWTPQRKAELPFPPFVTKLKEELGTLRLVTRGLGEDIDGRLLELKQSLKFLEKEISMHARSYRPTAVNLSPTQITSTPPPVIPMHQPVFHQQSKTPAFGEQSATPRSPPMSIRIVEAPKDPESPTRLAKPAVSPSPSPDLLSPIPPKPTNQQLSGAEAISPDALSPLRQPSPSPLQKMAAMSREAAAMAAKIKSPRDSMQSVASMASAMSGGSADGGLLEIIEEGEGEMEGITKREKNALDRLIELHDYVSGQLSEITLQYDGVVKACRRVLEWCAEEEPSDIALPHPPPKATAPTEGGNGGPETTGGGARDEKKETKITKKNLQVLDSASRLIIMTTDLIKAFESAWRDVIRSPASYESLVPTAGFIRLLKLPSPPPARARLSRTPRTAIKRPARELTPQTARPLFGDRCSNNSVEDRFPVPFALPLAQQQESPAIRVDGAGDIDEHPSPEVPSKSRRVSFGPSKIPLLDLTRLSAAEAAKGGQVDGGGDEAAKLRMSVPSLVQAFNRGAALRPPNAFASRIPVRVTPRDESRRAPLQMSPPPQVFNIAASDTDQGREELPEWKDHFWSPSGNPSAAASASASASASYPASRTVSHMESEVSGHMESEVSAEDPDAAEAD
uniref:FH2 domain-containing protein n=1 Tax=Vitrella brassicaformis TaxID=1169539 RepID=A0A7S1K1T2_9ALVE|mmetsp:Transcript_34587/g.85752  ORF Transcript_34587/g.85752 Transcript_34587/m.85752 type:complete len:985 (+) Transcript_34587:1613-4567(+)